MYKYRLYVSNVYHASYIEDQEHDDYAAQTFFTFIPGHVLIDRPFQRYIIIFHLQISKELYIIHVDSNFFLMTIVIYDHGIPKGFVKNST